ncbi:MAG: tetratricopeptide repeat protein [Deltaproteobacteria bacterium]
MKNRSLITPLIAASLLLSIATVAFGEDSRELLRDASSYVEKGDYKKALEYCNKSIDLDPSYSDAYFIRGAVHFAAGDYESSVKDFTAAIELDPTDNNAYFRRGKGYLKLGNSDMALEDFEVSCGMGVKEACDAYRDLLNR